jgi:hypothetical protein
MIHLALASVLLAFVSTARIIRASLDSMSIASSETFRVGLGGPGVGAAKHAQECGCEVEQQHGCCACQRVRRVWWSSGRVEADVGDVREEVCCWEEMRGRRWGIGIWVVGWCPLYLFVGCQLCPFRARVSDPGADTGQALARKRGRCMSYDAANQRRTALSTVAEAMRS